MSMPWFPASPGAWSVTGAGLTGFLGSLRLQGPMWAVEFGRRPFSPDRGEYVAALWFGAPALLLASLILGIAVSRETWRSRLGVALFLLCLLNLSTWALLLANAAVP